LFPQHLPILARVLSAAVNGIEAFPVEVEVSSGWGETIIVIIGLPRIAVNELPHFLRVRIPCYSTWRGRIERINRGRGGGYLAAAGVSSTR
jgi:hypothetical protein